MSFIWEIFPEKAYSPLTVVGMCVQLLGRVWLCVTTWTVAHQAPLSMGILQARILEWVAICSSQPRDWTGSPVLAGGFFTPASPDAHKLCQRNETELVHPSIKTPIQCSGRVHIVDTVLRKQHWQRASQVARGKDPAHQHSRCRMQGFCPWVRKIPQRRARQPTPVFLPGESHGQRSLEGYSPWGHKESDMTEVT